MSVVRVELDRHDWESLRMAGGTAEHVPGSILRLVAGQAEDEVSAAYWELENHVVVQGQLFESAYYVVPALLAALLEDPSRTARESILELLFQIVAGESHISEHIAANYRQVSLWT
ncbi:hypothetical protein [Sphaerisporangium album]|uniref:hypothetical protein n=1 Tax=Sphaerisporangium album TaxID=509200 RepID=UPI0015F061AC|nr:hypothetical protein [Sphaerisporangium album]